MPRRHRDLCSTCFCAPTCMYLGVTDGPKFECEEFLGQGNSRLSALVDPSEPASDFEVNPARSDGLCSDCENRKHCALRMPEGGVWRCEEYR